MCAPLADCTASPTLQLDWTQPPSFLVPHWFLHDAAFYHSNRRKLSFAKIWCRKCN